MCFKVPAWIYLILNTVVSSLISGAIDAGLTAAMYHPDIYKEVGVFVWPNTLAGNILLTALIQGTLTWFICHTLIRNGQRAKVLGIGRFPRPDCCDTTIPMIFCQSEDLLRCPPKGGCNWPSMGRLLLSLIKSLARGLLFGFTMVWIVGWPVTLILYGIEDTSIDTYEYWWLIVFMFVYGFCYGVIIAIPITIIALMSPKEEDEDEDDGVDEDDAEIGDSGSKKHLEKVPSSESLESD